MERIVKLPESSDTHITTHEVRSLIHDKGIILAFSGTSPVGFVYLEGNECIFKTSDFDDAFDDLESLLIEYPNITFKFIT